jgi:hydroxymethylpyrimidine/phosphomethylpyrimidine kinase
MLTLEVWSPFQVHAYHYFEQLKLKNSGMNRNKSYPIVLSIAGSDSSGGAGIQADLKTFSALGVYGATAITAITAQNTLGVVSQMALPPQMVREQIIAVMDDLHPSVVKIGMLSNAEIVNAVAEVLSEYKPKIILDPVIVSTSGHRLLSVEAQDVIKEKLLPISELVTPNIPEMETLTNMPLSSFEEKEKAANYLLSLGAKAVLLKGGHEDGEVKTDILFCRTHEVSSQLIAHNSQLVSESISTQNVHGTGCTLSSAIAAFLALDYSLEDAVREAKRYITEAIRAGADVKIGHGFGPVNHFFNPKPLFKNE